MDHVGVEFVKLGGYLQISNIDAGGLEVPGMGTFHEPLNAHWADQFAGLVLVFVNNGGRDMERGQGAISVYDKKTGLYLGKVIVPGRPAGNPITYMHEGKQYIAVATGGGRGPGMLYAFKLP